MTTRFKISLAAALAVVTMATAAPMLMAASSAKATEARQDQPSAVWGPPPGGGPGRMPGMRRGGPMGFGPEFRELDLTDDQKTQLRSIAESHRDEFRAAGEKARAAHEGMQALVEADSINESAIRAKSAEIAAAEAEVMILNAKVRQESMQVLTSEQQQKLKELRRAEPMRRRGPAWTVGLKGLGA